MKKIFTLLLLLLAAFAVYWFVFRSKSSHNKGPKQAPIALKKHSDTFNLQVDRVIDAYIMTKDALVNDDTVQAKQQIMIMNSLLDSLPLEELKKDTAGIYAMVKANIGDIRSNAESMVRQSSIIEMRRDFKALTDVMYPSFFKSINYEGKKLYLQHCPMAFGEDQGADWISNSEEIVNPYLGKNHPEYKSSMLHCGEVKDTIKAP